MKFPQLSVFFPAYNEEQSLATTVQKAVPVLKKLVATWEIIIVDDGSVDQTAAIAEELTKNDQRIRVIHHPHNRGYGAAFRSGVYAARYAWIAFTDSDGQFDFGEITKFFDAQKATNADLVLGYYLHRAVSLVRKLNTFLWESVVFLLFGLRIRNVDCGFKLFAKQVVDTITPLESERGAFISSEFLIKAKKAGFTMTEVSVHHYPRRAGQATGASLRVIFKSFLDLFRLWRKL